jgi:hypothetical protein
VTSLELARFSPSITEKKRREVPFWNSLTYYCMMDKIVGHNVILGPVLCVKGFYKIENGKHGIGFCQYAALIIT